MHKSGVHINSSTMCMSMVLCLHAPRLGADAARDVLRAHMCRGHTRCPACMSRVLDASKVHIDGRQGILYVPMLLYADAEWGILHVHTHRGHTGRPACLCARVHRGCVLKWHSCSACTQRVACTSTMPESSCVCVDGAHTSTKIHVEGILRQACMCR